MSTFKSPDARFVDLFAVVILLLGACGPRGGTATILPESHSSADITDTTRPATRVPTRLPNTPRATVGEPTPEVLGVEDPLLPGEPFELRTVDMIDGLHGWAIAATDGEDRLLRTEDGGVTWIDVSPLADQHGSGEQRLAASFPTRFRA